MYGIGDVAAEVVGVADREGGVDPAFDLDTQGAPGPPGAGVDVIDTVNGSGVLGGDQHAGVNAIEQPPADVRGHVVADVADEQGDRPGRRPGHPSAARTQRR